MVTRYLIRKIISPIPVISVSTILLFTLSFLIIKSLSEDDAGQLQFWITIIGGLGIVILVFFLVTNCYLLYRQYKRNEIGSKLTSKLVVIFFFLTVVPFSLIYFFAIEFLNKGVDNWFDVRVEQTVKDSILLSKTALEGIKEDITEDLEAHAKNLSQHSDSNNLTLQKLDEIRESEGYLELSLYGEDGRILAFSNASPENMLPNTPPGAVFNELRLNQTYTQIEPITDNIQQFRIVVPMTKGYPPKFFGLQAIKALPLRYATLASSIEKANSQYSQMEFARGCSNLPARRWYTKHR